MENSKNKKINNVTCYKETSNGERNGCISANSKSSKNQRKDPTCGRCNAHGDRDVKLSGHKRYCPYRNCDCRDCYAFLRKQRASAIQIYEKRACDLAAKRQRLPKEVEPLSFSNFDKKYGLSSLIYHTWRELLNSDKPIWGNAVKMYNIFFTLHSYARDWELGFTFDLMYAKKCISYVIHQDPRLDSRLDPYFQSFMMTFQQTACCSFFPSIIPYEGQPVGISSQYSLRNMFPENSLKPPTEIIDSTPFIDPSTESSTEPSTESSTELSTEPFIDPCTDSSTESSTNYW